MLRRVTILVAASVPLPAQQGALPKVGTNPECVVVDESGHRLAGCRAELLPVPVPGERYSRAIANLLKEAPLQAQVSDEGGRFTFRLTREQRLIGVGGKGRFVLQVSKDGFQSWCEPLPDGLSLWLGSRVVMRKIQAQDRLVILVTNAGQGARLGLRRIGEFVAEPWTWFEVPLDGRMAVPFPVAPMPFLASGIPSPIFVEACIARNGTILMTRHLENVIEPLELTVPTGLPERSDPVPESRVAASAALGSLRLRVTGAGGKPISGAIVMLEDRCFTGNPRSTPTSDADGRITLQDLPASGHQFLVLAEGCLPTSASYVVEAGALGQAAVRLTPCEFHDLRSYGSGGGFAPNVPVAVTTLAPGEQRGSTEVRTTDSEGRLRVMRAAGCTVAFRHATRLGEVAATYADGLAALTTESARSAVLRLGPSEYVTWIECLRDDRPCPEFVSAGMRNPTAWSVGGLSEKDDMALFCLNDAAPLRVFGTELRATGSLAQMALVIDRPPLVRRIALEVSGPGGAVVRPQRITPGANARWFDWRRGDLLDRNPGRVTALVARDRGSYDCVVWHPEYLPCPLHVPEQRGDSEERPVAVRLEPGTPLHLRLSCAAPLPALGTEYSIQVLLEDYELYVHDRIRAEQLGNGQVLELQTPAALAPAGYEVLVTVTGRGTAKARVTVEDSKPCTVELTLR